MNVSHTEMYLYLPACLSVCNCYCNFKAVRRLHLLIEHKSATGLQIHKFCKFIALSCFSCTAKFFGPKCFFHFVVANTNCIDTEAEVAKLTARKFVKKLSAVESSDKVVNMPQTLLAVAAKRTAGHFPLR